MINPIAWTTAAAVAEPALGMAYAPNDTFHQWRWEVGLGILILPFVVLTVLCVCRTILAWVLRHARNDPLM